MAYLVIGWLAPSAVGAVVFIGAMSYTAYIRCTKIVEVGQKGDVVRAAINCSYDPLPFGQAVGLIFAGFATLIGAFAAYMVATRRRGAASAPPGATMTATAKITPE